MLGSVNVRLVEMKGGGEGKWDHHDRTTETVVVWSSDFTVEFYDHALHLSGGQSAWCRSALSTAVRPKLAPTSS